MKAKKINRREFLRYTTTLAASTALAACAPKSIIDPTPEQAAKAPTTIPPTMKDIILDVKAGNPEWLNPERQIWDVFEAKHPGIKINLFAINETEETAYAAKVAGGYRAAIDLPRHLGSISGAVDQTNYQLMMNLGDIGFPWFDRFMFDAKNAWTEKFGIPGPRMIDCWAGWVCSWHYHADLMEKFGVDPRKEVNTWTDLKKFLDEGTKWVANDGPSLGINNFWGTGWLNPWMQVHLTQWPMAFADGQREQQRQAMLGKIKINGSDSPFRHGLEWLKEAYDAGWIGKDFVTTTWDDHEALYVAKKTVMLNHGPWVWDKALSTDPSIVQLGFPSTPPADGQPWKNWSAPAPINYGVESFSIPEGNQNKPEWEEIKTAFFWWFSPEAVKMRAEALGLTPLYELDEPLNLTGPQYVGFLKELEEGGLLSDVELELEEDCFAAASPYVKEGHTIDEVFDFDGQGPSLVAEMLGGKKSPKDLLDVYQANWENAMDMSKLP